MKLYIAAAAVTLSLTSTPSFSMSFSQWCKETGSCTWQYQAEEEVRFAKSKKESKEKSKREAWKKHLKKKYGYDLPDE